MKIGVMSDTHGSLLYFEKALDVLNNCDFILHCGDVLYHGPRNSLPEGYNPKELAVRLNEVENILIAKGNCDSDVDQMVINHPIQTPYVVSQFEKLRVLVTHGYVESKEDIIKKAKSMNAHMLICGHTHVKEMYLDDNLIVLNPGSTSIPKDNTHSVATIEIIGADYHELDLDINLIDINSGQIIDLD
ncbi:MAG: phosphodiesterase [Romboutsia sp.]